MGRGVPRKYIEKRKKTLQKKKNVRDKRRQSKFQKKRKKSRIPPVRKTFNVFGENRPWKTQKPKRGEPQGRTSPEKS